MTMVFGERLFPPGPFPPPMGVVAEFTIPPDAIPGGQALARRPDVRIELERIVPTNECALPFFWMFGADPDAFLSDFAAEPEIVDVELLTRVEDAALFGATWTPADEVIQGVRALQATIMEATGTAERWHFQVRAEDRDRLQEFQRIFGQQNIPVRLERMYNVAEILETSRPLTEEQRETLLVAFERGYFDQPREVTQAELGEHFGISSQAVAARLQRGIRNLIQQTLLSSGNGFDERGY